MSKKYLFLSLCFLVGFLQVKALDFYLAGSCNDWKPNLENYKFSEEDGVYTLSLTSLGGDFKITTPGWEHQYGCKTPVKYGETVKAIESNNSYNITLPDNPAHNVLITFDYKNLTLKFDILPTLFLVGDFNSWLTLPKYQFTLQEGLYVLTTESFTGKFKIICPDYDYSLGNGAKIQQEKETLISLKGGDMSFDGGNSSMIRITVTQSSLLSTEDEEETEVNPDDPQEQPGEDMDDKTEEFEPDQGDNKEEDSKDDDSGNETEPSDKDDQGNQEGNGSENNGNGTDNEGGIGNGSNDNAGNTDQDGDKESGGQDIDSGQGGSEQDPGNGDDQNSSGGSNEDVDDSNEPGNGNGGEEIPGETETEGPGDNEESTPEGDNTDPGGVSIIEEDELQPVYYDLRGFKVENPSRGLFIRKTGTKTEKIYLP